MRSVVDRNIVMRRIPVFKRGKCRNCRTFINRTFNTVIGKHFSYNRLHTHYCVGDKIENNEMGGACNFDVGVERCV
jgi:hypothetical protein